MTQFDFDLFTIGAGSGGVAGTRRAAAYGARTAICEDSRVGGTCVIRGCVPKKLLVYAAQFRDAFADAAGFGWTVGETSFDWGRLIGAKNSEIDRLEGIYGRLLDNSGVTVIKGRGRIVAPHTVEVAGQRYTAKNIMIATGGRPVKPGFDGEEHAVVSDDALDLPRLPASIIIIGGGYIAVEFAGIFNGLGVKTSLMIRGRQILNGFDDDIRDALAEEMTKRGIDIIRGVTPAHLAPSGDGYALTDSAGVVHQTGLVMAGTGRKPNIAGLGLEEAGVRLTQGGAIAVDEWSQTSAPGIYAVGDVTDRAALTPVAIAEGRGLAETLFNNNPMRVSYDNIPTAVFSIPPLGTVGLSEAQARADGRPVDIYKTGFRPMKHALSGRNERVVIKLVVDGASQKVLGCHIMGMDAPEMIQAVAIALNMGATKADFDRTIALHPSTAEELVLLREKS